MFQFSVLLICILNVSGQVFFPTATNGGLPSPQAFLRMLLNDTTVELIDLVSDFSFEDIGSQDISFLLYKPDGTSTRLNMDSDFQDINKNKPLKFLVHGWQEAGDHDFIKGFTKSYNSIGIRNIFGIDWSSHSKRSYVHAARGTKKLGELIGHFIMKIVKENTKLLANVHIIGHSLGAHIAAFAGKTVIEMTNGTKIGRITALDAAGPLFEFPVRLPRSMRLTNDDAEFVDGIHSNSGFLGFLTPYADTDFYINYGGPIQAGCMNVNVFEAFACSHAKSYLVYNRTITSRNYLATYCDSPIRALTNSCRFNQKIVMGEHTDKDAEGEFFISIDSNHLPESTIRRIRTIFWG